MEARSSLLHSQEPATCPYPQPAQSSPNPSSQFLKNHFNLICELDLCLTVHHQCRWSNMERQLDVTITVLLISKISSTCFGQTFAHLQERKTEIFTTYGIMSWWRGRQGFWALLLSTTCTVHVVLSSSAHKPCLPRQYDIISYVVKISVLRSWRCSKVCPETCWADLGDQ
jgi:hypothetical protein